MGEMNPTFSFSVSYLVPFIILSVSIFMVILLGVLNIFSAEMERKEKMESRLIFFMAVILSLYSGMEVLSVVYNYSEKWLLFFTQIKLISMIWIVFFQLMYITVVSEAENKNNIKYFLIINVIAVILISGMAFIKGLFISQSPVIMSDALDFSFYHLKYSSSFYYVIIPIIVLIYSFSIYTIVKFYNHRALEKDKKRINLIFIGFAVLSLSALIELLSVFDVVLVKYFSPAFLIGIALSTLIFVFASINRIMLINQKILHNKRELTDLRSELNIQIDELDEKAGGLSDKVQELSETMISLFRYSKMTGDYFENLQVNTVEGVDKTKEGIGIIEQNMQVFKNIAEMMNKQKGAIFSTKKYLDDLRKSVENISENSNEMADSISNLSKKVDDGKKLVENNLVSMKNIKQSVEKVFYIIDMINDISEQTNILAMNAAIEASHAGQYGRGFAVVAEEIRNVSIMTFNEAESIRNSVFRIIEMSVKGEQMVQETSDIFENFFMSLEKLFSYIVKVIDISKNLMNEIEDISIEMNVMNHMAIDNSKKSENELDVNEDLLQRMQEIKNYIVQFVGELDKKSGKKEKMIKSIEELTDIFNDNSEKALSIEDMLSNINNGFQS